MHALLLWTFSCTVLLCASSPYNPDDYRKRIILESAGFPSSPESRIIGGGKATIEEYPFVVSLQNNGTFFGHDVEHFCGGSIIGEKWIITSAQCALRIHVANFHVRAGTRYYYKGGAIYGVKSTRVHPLFNEITYDYDFGLIELTESIEYDSTKQPIKLPQHTQIENGAKIQVLGWGAARMLGPVSDELLDGGVSKISEKDCEYASRVNSVTQRMFCILSHGISPCVGDSGSPAILKGTLLGVASWSRSCAQEYPTAYAAVSEVTNWIAEITGIS